MQHLIIDFNNILWRAWSVMPEMTSPDGSSIGAVYGLCNMILKLKREHRITSWMACGDGGGPTWRNALDPIYKQSGGRMPDALYAQLSHAREMLAALGIPLCIISGWEADDLIGTVLAHTEINDDDVLICSEDIDFYQLVNSKIRISRKSGIIDTQAIRDKLDIFPSQIVDYKALVGCGADGVPGVPGVGHKTATTLLHRYLTLENLLDDKIIDELDKLDKRMIRARVTIQQYRERVILNKTLVTISENAPIPAGITFGLTNIDLHTAHQYFDKMEFKSLHNRL